MTAAHVFAETNFLYHVFHMPSKRLPDAVALRKRFDAAEIKLYVPYVCFQEARHRIREYFSKQWSRVMKDLREFHRYAEADRKADWDFGEVKKLLDAATAEMDPSKPTFPSELRNFTQALGDGVLHGTKEVFDFLESLDLEVSLEYNDKLVLSSVLVKAKELYDSGEKALYFVSIDKSDLKPKDDRDKKKLLYDEAGLTFVSSFVLSDMPATST
jgi:hypothetical protein